MPTEIFTEALLANEDLADWVWELWDAGAIADDIAALAWAILAMRVEPSSTQKRQKKTYTAPT